MEQFTVSEMITKLQEILEKYGNLKVYHVEFGSCEKVKNIVVDTIICKEHSKNKSVIIN